MKNVTVIFKAKNGNTAIKHITTAGSVFTAVKLLESTHSDLKYVSHSFTTFEVTQ